jgi:predicted dehydrogenase
MNDFRWGLVGPGSIAGRFAEAVNRLPGTRIGRVHGRDSGRTQAFVERWTPAGKPPAQVSLDFEDLLADPEIDAIYIATPHSHHGASVRAALMAGKPVLCEKPLVARLAEAEQLIATARSQQVFLMEALWTRFLPIYAQVATWLQQGRIGRVQAMQSSFCFSLPFDALARHFNPALAGGTLLDIGIYNLAMGRWVLETTLGACPELVDLQTIGQFAPTGVESRVAATLHYAGGVVSQFVCAFDGCADNTLRIQGERGSIVVQAGFWEATEAVLNEGRLPPFAAQAAFRFNGFEYEIEEVMRCVRGGLKESPRMPLQESWALARDIDALRRALGVA